MKRKNITLTTTTAHIGLSDVAFPVTICLKSADASRAIQLSADGGTEYYTLSYDVTTATQLVVAVTAPVTSIKLTGAINDTAMLVEN